MIHEKRTSSVSSAWATPSALAEANSLLTFMKHEGLTVGEIKELIGVNDSEFRELNQWANEKPAIAGALDGAMIYRQKVLQIFLSLVGTNAEPINLPATRRKQNASRQLHNDGQRSKHHSTMRL